MPAHLTINIKKNAFQINEKLLQRRAFWLMRQNKVADHDVSILFVDDKEISWLNSHYRGKQGPTNVLSFPFDNGTEDALTLSSIPVKELGDIIISVETAQKEAKKQKVSLHDR
ncbi:MAG TPA: rRNA maturation RNase YbeY, partial [Desulfobacterales bacterium]|nr:rRNA maturation RNase YbeY [Desulfobacterales bacterium]